jgi:hypothetical protein
MAETFKVESNERGASLTLREYDSHYFLAELHHPGLDARAKVGSYTFGGLADFFAGLAEHWKGWRGTRKWGSLEGELSLTAESDRTGHVRLLVRLDDGAPPYWRTDLTLNLEVGQLEQLVAGARAFERSVRSAT